MKRTTIISVLFFAATITFGQASSYDLPKIIPPSPAAQTFMRYGEIPVDYSTGVPSIEIPIYTVEGRQLKVPISISYHASGIKVNDIASEVGLGWALNCGGLVSRTINGIRDEATGLVRTYDNATELMNACYAAADEGYDQSSGCMNGIRDFENFLNQVFGNEEDPIKDRYFYRLPSGLSGIFTYDFVNSGTAVTLPYRHLYIEKFIDWSRGWPRIGSFKITDDNGIAYAFETVLTNPTQDYSEWFLTKMISADGTDTISFNYILQTANPSIPASRSQVYQGWAENVGADCSPLNFSSSVSTSVSPLPQFTTPVLESIVSSKAIVRFSYDNRDDFDELKRLTMITVGPASSPSQIIKRVDLIPKYFGTTEENRRLGLEGIVLNAQDDQPEQYTFSYESQVLPPYPFKTTNPLQNSEDFWGYYNGSNNNSYIPSEFISNLTDRQNYGANREAGDYAYSKACMLKEIQYPTGGKTVFEFERFYSFNAYPYHINDQDGYVGGFRVARITNYTDDNTVANIKTYQYELPVVNQIGPEDYTYDQPFLEKNSNSVGQCWATFSREMVFSGSILPLEVAPGMPVMYRKVTEYNGTLSNPAGKTVYTYNAPYSPSDYFNNPEHPLEFEAPQFYHPFHYDRGNYVPELQSKIVYAFDGTSYHPVSKDEYVYTRLFAKTFNTGIKVSRTKHFPGIDYWCFQCPLGPTSCSSIAIELIAEYKASLVAIDTKVYQEASLLTNSKNYVYDPLDESKYVLTSTNYTYNEENLAIKDRTTISSKGDELMTAYKYPHNYSGNLVYDNMLSRNIITPAVEEQTYKNGDFLQSVKTNFDFWNGTNWSTTATNIIAPRTVQTQILNSAPEVRLRYQTYDDKANITAVSKENDVKLSYIWGYNKNYPIAEVVNAEAKDVFHTSFEEGDGNSSNGDCKTGRKSKVNGFSKTLTGLTNQSYKLSYWSESGSVWTLHTSTVSVSAGSYVISISGKVDEVRFCPVNAQMTTLAYDPLIGVISRCGPDNRTTYYEYDQAGRLSMVRDQNKNILKRICYNFDGQPETCSVYVNTDQSRNYFSQNCGSQTPLPYYVSVPAGMFTSNISVTDANTKAQQYAQQQANQSGTCQADIAITYTNYGPTCYIVEFYNPQTGLDLWFPVEGSAGTLGYVPPGTYDILITSSCDGSNNRIYYAACNMTTGFGSATFIDVTVNSSCYNIGIQ